MIKSYKLRRGLANTIVYVILALLGLIWISPLAYLIIQSFSADPEAIPQTLIPSSYGFQNYVLCRVVSTIKTRKNVIAEGYNKNAFTFPLA